MMPLDQMLLNPCGLLEYICTAHYAVTVVKLKMSLDIKICRTIYPSFEQTAIWFGIMQSQS